MKATKAKAYGDPPRARAARAIEHELAQLQAHMNAAMAKWLGLVAEFDRISDGDPVERWAAWRFGVSPGEAREVVRVARALQNLPVIQAAFARGELTYTKVRALTRVATPECEARLVDLAGVLTASQLQRALRVYERVSAARAGRSHELEYVSYYWAEDGSLVLRARLPAEDGTVLVRALDAARDRIRERRRKVPQAAPQRPAEVEALAELARATRVAKARADKSALRTPAPPRLVVHVDAAALAEDAPGRCELEHGPVIPPETARRLGCDAATLTVTERDGLPLSVGRKRRTVPTWIRRHLEIRDQGSCQWPGCANRRYLDAHHKHHWAQGGDTSLDNLVLLCWHHHRLVHEGGYTVEPDPEHGIRFKNRYGVAVPTVPRPPPGSADALDGQNRRAGLEITAKTNRHGTGERLDLDAAVQAVHSIVG
jgi:Domain of unknown function (DUF222)/HNH endonuclease